MNHALREAGLLARMLAWRAVLPLLRRRVRIATLARVMWREPHARPGGTDPIRIAELARVLYRGPGRGQGDTCLERSLLAYRYLSKAGVDPQLVIGIGRPDSLMIGHAWVVVNDEPLYDSAAEVGKYSSFFSFGRGGALLATPSDRAQVGAVEG